MKKKNVYKAIALILSTSLVCTPITGKAAPKAKLNKKAISLTVGDKTTLKVKNARKVGKWTSSNTKVATVTQKGVVKAKKAGVSIVSVKVKGKKLNCKVTVKGKIGLNKEDVILLVGEKTTLKVKNTSEKVEWSSNDEDIATVTQKGEVKAIAEGTAEIVAEVGEEVLTCEVIVVEKDTETGNTKQSEVTPTPVLEVTPVPTENITTTASATEVPASQTTAIPSDSDLTTSKPEDKDTTKPLVTTSAAVILSPNPNDDKEDKDITKPSEDIATEKPLVTTSSGVVASPDMEDDKLEKMELDFSMKTKEGGEFVIGASTQQITFRVTGNTKNVNIVIRNENGENVFEKNYTSIEQGIDTIFNWNGKNNAGNYIEQGMYHVVIIAGKEESKEESFYAYSTEQASYVSLAVTDLYGNHLPEAKVEIQRVGGNSYTETLHDSENFKGYYTDGEYQFNVSANGYDQATGSYIIDVMTNPKNNRTKVSVVMIPSNITIAESGIQDGIVWKLTTNGELILTGKYTGTEDGQELSFENSQWSAYADRIYTAYVDVENLPSLRDLFWQFTALKRVSFGTNMNKGTVVTMRSTFNSASSLTSVDITNLNTENVTNMFRTFSGCSSLQKLDLSDLNTKNVTDMGWMFAECIKLTELNVATFDVTNLETMEAMFNMCNSLEEIDLSGWGNSNVKNMTAAFYNNDVLKSINMRNFITSKATSMESMFGYCPLLTTILWDKFDTGNVTTTKLMFERCSSLINLDLTGWDLSKVQDMEGTFAFCSGLKSVNLSGMNLSSVTNMEAMFYECTSLVDLNLSNINTVSVQNMAKMFGFCTALTKIELKDLDTTNVTDMSYMFENCTGIKEFDFKDFVTGTVTNMEGMFLECSAITNLDLSSFDTSKVTNMKALFDKCYALTNVNVSSFDTSNVTDMGGMFEQCKALKSVDVSNFNTEKVTSMTYMFYLCTSLESLNAANFATPSLTDCSAMFAEDTNLKNVNLQNFDTSSVPNMANMFLDCAKMESVLVGSKWDMTQVNAEGKAFFMFSGCGVSDVTY